jgi:phosphatidate cytidylyltransferase
VKRVATAAVLIPIVILALFKAPLWLFTLLVFGVAVLAAHEYFGIVKAQGFRPFELIIYVFLAIPVFIVIATLMFPPIQGVQPAGMRALAGQLFVWSVPFLALWLPLVLLLAGLRREPLSQSLPDAAMSYIVVPYVGFNLGSLLILRSMYNGAIFVLFLMVLVWCGDIAAYYVGRAIGKHKLAPRVSPGKSLEGAIASVLAAVVVGVMLFHFIPPIGDALRRVHLVNTPRVVAQYASWDPHANEAPLWLVALFAFAVNVAAQLGDLVESALKRGAGVKDSGRLLPGHGGVLDRVDALLFALPVGLIFYVYGLDRYIGVA